MHKPVRTAAAAIYEHHDTYLLHICDGSESQRYKVSAGLLCPVYIFWLAAHETDETVFISLKNLRPTARSFYTINSTSEVRFTGVFKDTKARYMEIKKSKQAFLGRTWDRTDNSEHLAQKESAPAVQVFYPWLCRRSTGSIHGDDFKFFIS